MARAGLARSRSRSRSRSLRAGGVAFLILFSALSASPALAENRNGPIRLRENLWATGHFMGKKSPLSPTPLHSSSLERAEPNHIPRAFSPAVTSIVDDMKDLLTRELLKILLQQKLLEENQGKQDPKEQDKQRRLDMCVVQNHPGFLQSGGILVYRQAANSKWKSPLWLLQQDGEGCLFRASRDGERAICPANLSPSTLIFHYRKCHR